MFTFASDLPFLIRRGINQTRIKKLTFADDLAILSSVAKSA
jgi:hypothetical protein